MTVACKHSICLSVSFFFSLLKATVPYKFYHNCLKEPNKPPSSTFPSFPFTTLKTNVCCVKIIQICWGISHLWSPACIMDISFRMDNERQEMRKSGTLDADILRFPWSRSFQNSQVDRGHIWDYTVFSLNTYNLKLKTQSINHNDKTPR